MKNKYLKGVLVFICIFSIMAVVFILQIKFDDNTGKDPEIEDFKNKKIEEIQTEEKTKKELNSLVEILFDDNVTREDIGHAIGVIPESVNIFYGKDSFIRSIGNDVKRDVKYEEAVDKYANELESLIKSNFNFEIKDYIISADGDIVQEVKYRTYYYVDFIKDYTSLCNELLEYTDIDLEKIVNVGATDEEKVIMYKVNVKALEIMSHHFEDYINENETLEYALVYRKGDKSISNEYFSLFMYFSGVLYKNSPNNDNNRDMRIKNIITEAINEGTLVVNNPYKLN